MVSCTECLFAAIASEIAILCICMSRYEKVHSCANRELNFLQAFVNVSWQNKMDFFVVDYLTEQKVRQTSRVALQHTSEAYLPE